MNTIVSLSIVKAETYQCFVKEECNWVLINCQSNLLMFCQRRLQLGPYQLSRQQLTKVYLGRMQLGPNQLSRNQLRNVLSRKNAIESISIVNAATYQCFVKEECNRVLILERARNDRYTRVSQYLNISRMYIPRLVIYI